MGIIVYTTVIGGIHMLFDKILPPAHIHMIGIGGISMSGLAEILKYKGYIVSGSDMTESHITKKLSESGININIGHRESNCNGADAIIYTAAIKKDNPEFVYGETHSIPLIERSVLLGEITKMFPETIAVSGTHGKTTTTSMIATCFINDNQDPTVTVGGELNILNGNYRIGNHKFLITEACEYVDSFLKFFPKCAIVLNVEEDHLDYFKDIEQIKNSFKKFLDKLPSSGYAVLNADDKNSKELILNTNANIITIGINNSAMYMAKNINIGKEETCYDLFKNDSHLCKVTLKIPGVHNIYNSLACIAVSEIYGLNLDSVLSSLNGFSGAKRRFEKKGMLNGALIYDDYAHHPSEIKATLAAAKNKGFNRILCAFQPHTYTRTKTLFNEFASAFYDADKVIITDIYAAREKDTGEISSEMLVHEIEKTSKNAIYIKNFSDIETYLEKNLKPGDLFLTIGAGNIYEVGEKIAR